MTVATYKAKPFTRNLNESGLLKENLFSETWDTADASRNILLYPSVRATRVRQDVLAALQGGLVTDSTLRARVSAIVGPGATLRGIAEQIRPMYVSAATTAQPAPTIDQLAQAILVYSQYYLPATTFIRYDDGLRIPLPIEIDRANGDWVINSNLIRTWSRSFLPAWTPFLTQRARRLPQPDARALIAQVQTFITTHTTALARGINLNARVLSNAFKEVYFTFELLKQLPIADKFALVLVFADQSVNHQIRFLASLSAGNAILRELLIVLQNPPARITQRQTASLNRAQTMLTAALQPAGRLTVARELPETAQQLVARRGRIRWQAILPTDPTAGSHRMVLGRDVLAGQMGNLGRFHGPAYGGRISPSNFIAANGNLLNPRVDARLAARLTVVEGIVVNEGFLDAVRLRDTAVLSLGIQQSSAHVDIELPALLGHYKAMAPEEFRLFFELHGLDVRANGNDRRGNPSFMLQSIQANGARRDLVNVAQKRTFFGGTMAGGITTFTTDWAARVRTAAIVSLNFKVAQVIEAASRFDRISRELGRINIAGAAAPVFATTLITSQLGAALIIDSHINRPGFVQRDLQNAANAAGAQPNADALDQAITREYARIRRTHNTPVRNANINRLGFNVSHGSFAGW
jgi:hypothetical protein